MTLCLFLVLANDQGRLLTSVAVLPLFSTKQVRQPGDVRGDPSRFIVGHEIGCGTPSWLPLEIDVGYGETVVVPHHIASVVCLIE